MKTYTMSTLVTEYELKVEKALKEALDSLDKMGEYIKEMEGLLAKVEYRAMMDASYIKKLEKELKRIGGNL